MLSRVAERLYWMARYLERAENTSRLLAVYQGLLLDLPKDADLGWTPLLDILGYGPVYEGPRDDSKTIQRYIVADPDNPNSLLHTLQSARENARTTRDLIPTEAWRAINELHLYAADRLPKSGARSRSAALQEIIGRCQMISGLLAATMSQDAPYQFIRAGRNLERADMTTRLIDVAAALLMSGRSELKRYDNTLWMAVLRSISAYQMYRQHVRRRVCGPDVIKYLLNDRSFPRAVAHCLGELQALFSMLPRPDQALDALERVGSQLESRDSAKLKLEEIHAFVDELQQDIGGVHNAICAIWFLPQEHSV